MNTVKSKQEGGFLWIVTVIIVIAFLMVGAAYQFYTGHISLKSEGEIASSISFLGQTGDFFGGILNPVFSFLALLAILISMHFQREELKASRESLQVSQEELALTREELQGSKEAMQVQAETMKTQKLENAFFNLLEINQKQLAEVSADDFINQKETKAYGTRAIAIIRENKGWVENHTDRNLEFKSPPVRWVFEFMETELPIDELEPFAKNLHCLLSILGDSPNPILLQILKAHFTDELIIYLCEYGINYRDKNDAALLKKSLH